MKKATIRIAAVTIVLSLPLLLAGCKEQVLDYRNTEIVNGKVYEKSGNEPFTGKVTNLPINVITPIANDIDTFNRELKHLMAGDQYGAYFNPAHCDASVKRGFIEGDGTCFDRQHNVPILKFHVQGSGLQGDVELFSAITPDRLIAKGSFNDGKRHGIRELFNPNTGKLVSHSEWKDGVQPEVALYYHADGKTISHKGRMVNGGWTGQVEEFHDNGKLARQGIWTSGYPDGEFRAWDANGKLYLHRIVRGPFVEKDLMVSEASPSTIGGMLNDASKNASNTQSCVELWTKAHRKQVGDDAAISIPQLDEWEEWCKEGKQPH